MNKIEFFGVLKDFLEGVIVGATIPLQAIVWLLKREIEKEKQKEVEEK